MKAVAKLVDLFAGMNGTEKEFALILETQRRNGDICSWRFEALSLNLAKGSAYTPDFLIVHLDGTIQCAETKGFWREAARVRIKVAASLFPEFTFTAHRKRPKKEGGGWVEETFTP